MDKTNRKTRITKRSFNQMRDHSDEVAVMQAAGNVMLPVVHMKFHGKTMKFLLDTGSDANYLDDRIFELLKDNMEYRKMEGFTIGAAGKQIPRSYLAKMDLGLAGRTYETHFSVMRLGCFPDDVILSTLPFYGILGCDFLIRNHWILDFQKYVVQEKKL